jgi:DNA-binding transcriptional MocR family regulator
MSRYSHLYTPLLELLAPSPVSRLMAGHRPDAIQLTGGDPDPDYFPRAEIKEITDYIMDREAATALQYGDPAGYRKLREQIVRIANTKRQNAQLENVMVISGSAESFDLMCKVFISPGDHILIEEPSYSGAVTSFRAHGCTLVPVPVDDDGIIPEQAEKTLAQKKAEGVRVKFMYILPNYQNPTGATLPLERRRRLLAIAKEYGASSSRMTLISNSATKGKSFRPSNPSTPKASSSTRPPFPRHLPPGRGSAGLWPTRN